MDNPNQAQIQNNYNANVNANNIQNPNMIPNVNPNIYYNNQTNMHNNFNQNGPPSGFPNQVSNIPSQDFLIQNDFFKEGNFQAFYASDYLLALRNAKSAFIKQKVELFEVLTGCETKNRYSVYLRYDNGVNALLFKCKEESSWCARNCLNSDSRPFQMKVKFIKNSMDFGNDDYNSPNIVFERPYKCTCCCFGRPEMHGYNKSNNTSLGRVYEPFKCCDPTYKIFNAAEQLKYTITANCCQCGFMCKKCAETKFDIFSSFNELNSERTPVGSIIKKFSGFMKEIFTDADNFEIFFPQDATPEDKLMIIGTTLMIDYRFFEDNGKDRNHKKGLLMDL